jgi:hypothetical protein
MKKNITLVFCAFHIFILFAGRKIPKLPAHVTVERVKKFSKKIISQDVTKVTLGNLSITDLTGIQEVISADCTELDLSENKLHGSELAKLAKVNSDAITSINMHKNCIKFIEPEHISQLKTSFPSLKEFDVSENPIENLNAVKQTALQNNISIVYTNKNGALISVSIPSFLAPEHYSEDELTDDEL